MKNLPNLRNPKNTLVNQKKIERRTKRAYSAFACVVMALTTMIIPAAAAANQPLQIVQNLSDFIFSLIKAVGMILLGYGILQVGLSLQSHDPSQRSNGILTIAGGIVITFAKEILALITATAA